MKTFIGRWVAPSGNGCDIYIIKDELGRDIGHVWWDNRPPSPEDVRLYEDTVLAILANTGLVFLEVTTR